VREFVNSLDKEMYTDILHRLRDAVRGKHPKAGERIVGFSITTMLQDTGRLWSMISEQRSL